MFFQPAELDGAFLIHLEAIADDRGFFARSYCDGEFEEHGLNTTWVQCNISYNRRRGTLRGMHYQAAPHEEVKLVRCTAGRIHDVIADIRPDSPTFGRYQAFELSAENRHMLYIPAGFAHGFLTLEPGTEVFYHMGAYYAPESARGFRYNDPAFGIAWPAEPHVISEKDAGYSDFNERPAR